MTLATHGGKREKKKAAEPKRWLVRCLGPGKGDHWWMTPDKVNQRVCGRCRALKVVGPAHTYTSEDLR